MAHAQSRGLIDSARPASLRDVPDQMIPVPENTWGDGLDTSLFTHPVYLRAQGNRDVLCLRVSGLADRDRALFSPTGRYLTYLNRLAVLTPAEVGAIAEAAFDVGDARFIIFPDTQLRRDGSRVARPHHSFNYQANWWRALGQGETCLSNRQALRLRRKNRKLAEYLGVQTDFTFRRTIASDIDMIGDLNKTKIESTGGTYLMSVHKRDALRDVACKIGYTATIHAAGRLIAGMIICVTKPNAYGMITGYDLEFGRFSQGLRVGDRALAELGKLGLNHVNLLWGDTRCKADLGAERRLLTTVLVCRNRRDYLDPALFRSAFTHAKLELKSRIKAVVTRSAV